MSTQVLVIDNVHDVLSAKDEVEKQLEAEAKNDTIVNKSLVDKQPKFVRRDIKDFVFGSFGRVKNIPKENSGDTNTMMELIFPHKFVRVELDIEFGSYNRHKKGPIEHPSDISSVQKGLTSIFPATLGSGEVNIEFGTFGCDKKATNEHLRDTNNVKILEKEEKVNLEGVEDMDDDDKRLKVQNFLMKVLKLDQEVNLNKQIENADMELNEKTKFRDGISDEIQMKRESMRAHNDEFNVAIVKIKAAKQLVKSKWQEINYVRRVMNKKIKNTVSIEDIDSNDEIPLQFKDQLDERLTNLEEELKALKEDVSKAGMAAKAISKTYLEVFETEKELRAQFIAANEICQEAYNHLDGLKKRLNDKNKSVDFYKEDVAAPRSFGSCGDIAALHYLCANRAGRFVGQWITDEDYFKDYMVPIPDEMPSVSTVETQKTGSCVEGKLSDDQSIKNVAGEKKQIMIIKETSNPIVKSERIDNTEKEDTNEIRVRDELSKENIESELKEQSQLEDRMKANEAIERNTQNAKEARMRAEVRTQKEAKQKESVERLRGQWTRNDVTRNFLPITNEITFIPAVSTVETQEPVSCVEEKHSDDQSNEKVAANDIQTMRSEESAKSIVRSGIIDNTEEEEVYEMSKVEIESKLKVQCWLEETMKTNEAFEREIRVAEEARMLAEVQAQKEAKKKERARIKRLRKKKNKRTGMSGSNINDQDVVESNEIENTKEEKPQCPPSHFLSKQSKVKTIVSPSTVKLAMRKMVLAVTLVLALFTLLCTK